MTTVKEITMIPTENDYKENGKKKKRRISENWASILYFLSCINSLTLMQTSFLLKHQMQNSQKEGES